MACFNGNPLTATDPSQLTMIAPPFETTKYTSNDAPSAASASRSWSVKMALDKRGKKGIVPHLLVTSGRYDVDISETGIGLA
jgi:hypothetical protein